MSNSCLLDRASNVEIGVECQIFVVVIFFNCDPVLQFGGHSRYYKGALIQKRSFLVICTTFRSDFNVCWKNQSKHSTLKFALSKWHEPDIRLVSTKIEEYIMLGSEGKKTEFEQFPCPYCQEVSKKKLFIEFTLCNRLLRTLTLLLSTRLIIKISTHPWYPSSFDLFSWEWSRKKKKL
jgi:hypothetical protein